MTLMDIIVEDGSGVDNANSYTEILVVDAYAFTYGISDWEDMTEDQKKISMFKAKRYFDFLPWKGTKVKRDQHSAFPREGLVDGDGFELPNDEIPHQLIYAFCEASTLFMPTSEVDLEPVITKEDYIVQESFVDVASTTYGRDMSSIKPKSTVISYMLKGLLKSQFIVTIYRS